MSKIQNFLKLLIIFIVDNMNLKIYDNSMSEWAKDDSLPIEKD